jgi:hypothetical protein
MSKTVSTRGFSSLVYFIENVVFLSYVIKTAFYVIACIAIKFRII